MSSSSRKASYSVAEDVHLCHVYLDISQNPIIGINQSKDRFWTRVEEEYHSNTQFVNPHRPKRSLQKRMQTITSAISKLKGCIRQIENLNPSGASEQDILSRAKILLIEDPNYPQGFKFDHVWHILKDIEKFGNDDAETPMARFQRQRGNIGSSQTGSLEAEIPTSESPRMSSFDLNITNEDSGATSTRRPTGVKKSKGKRKNDQQLTKIIQQNHELVEVLRQGNIAAERREENKILFKDLNSISDPVMCEFIRGEQLKIMQKRNQGEGSQSFPRQGEGSQFNQLQDEGQGSQNPSNVFGQFYDYFGGSGNDFLPY